MGFEMPLSSVMRPLPRRLRLGALLAACIAAAPLAGCNTVGGFGGMTASIDQQPLPTNDADLRAYAENWGKRYDASPGEKTASINYARALRALTRYDEAVAVTQSAAVKAPQDYEVLAAYGKALADDGQFAQAKEVLGRSYAPERPDWTIMSVQGSVEDRLGDHDAARQFYRDALKIAPGEPSVLTNLGLSYALTKELPLAEDALRQASASPHAGVRTREDLALVLALEGKFPEAETVSRRDMSADAASADVEAIRHMIAQSDTWRDLQTGASAKTKRASKAPDPSAPSSPLALGQPSG
jgi:Flp pilus assembly protein TadD